MNILEELISDFMITLHGGEGELQPKRWEVRLFGIALIVIIVVGLAFTT